MAVGDVEVGNLCELLGDFLDGVVVVDHPEGVAESVGSHEVILGLACGHLADYLLKGGVVGECEEHRLDVGVVDAHVFHAVFLFVAACKLMLLDASLHVVVYPCAYNEAVLCASVHCLGVDVILLLGILHEPSLFLEFFEILHGLLIYPGVVLVETGLEVDFRLYDVIE